MSDRRAFSVIGAVSVAAVGFLIWLIYAATPAAVKPAWVGVLPGLNATFNTCAALCMLAGVSAIRAGRPLVHRRWMLAALAASTLFLLDYIAYHHFHGDTKFLGTGWVRPLYFVLLISHILLSMLVLPLLLTVVWFAGLGVFERHRRLARVVFPLWLYVSVTGVAVYFFLRPYY